MKEHMNNELSKANIKKANNRIYPDLIFYFFFF